MRMHDTETIIAWDFDGVLNRNVIDGQFVWTETFETDLGQSRAAFEASIFNDSFVDVILGKEDVRDRVSEWAMQVGFEEGADALLAYWFKKDAQPDAEVGQMMDALADRGQRQIIVTNNEARRAVYIEHQMGFGARVEHLFASGRMGVGKPDTSFFSQVTKTLDAMPKQMLLIDDCPKNILAAIQCGWKAFHFTAETRGELGSFLGLEL